jgi:hypothetical protein
MPVLLKVLAATNGPVLELGVGTFSTILMHYMCLNANRLLVSYDSDIKYINLVKDCASDIHKIQYVANWDEVDILKPWSVAFIDHSPGPRRGLDAGRLANYAEYVVCHDSEIKRDSTYEYSKVYDLFKYRWEYRKLSPPTMVFSNFHTLEWLER